MKFDVISSVVDADAMENGAWCHLRSPIVPDGDEQGPLMYRDPERMTMPCRAKVRSFRSKAYTSKDFAIQSKAMNIASRGKGQKREDALNDAMMSERPRKFATLLVGLENCSSGSKGLETMTDQEAVAFAQDPGNKAYVDQIMSFAFDDNNFPGAAATAGNAEALKADVA